MTSEPVYGLAEPSNGRAPAGWRLESSLGVEIAVPEGWSLNDYGCPMSAQPTVEHWKSDMRDCGRAEPPDKDVAVIYADGFDYDETGRCQAAQWSSAVHRRPSVWRVAGDWQPWQGSPQPSC